MQWSPWIVPKVHKQYRRTQLPLFFLLFIYFFRYKSFHSIKYLKISNINDEHVNNNTKQCEPIEIFFIGIHVFLLRVISHIHPHQKKKKKSHTLLLLFVFIVLFSNKSFPFIICLICSWFVINWYLNNTHLFHPNKSNLTMDHILFFIVNFHTRRVFGLH